ncbi:MAG TPA: HAMP domain-containing sensor histidine kinase [Longimicrobiales bacterium]|nr:HAMP domain-containing sensor histidine kinase [Longimicrobiales bacterium]
MKREGGRTTARTVRVVSPLLLALAFAMALAYLAFNATRARRDAARRTVTDFADFAAFIVGNAAQQEIERRLLYAFGPLRAWDSSSGDPLPDPTLIGRDRFELQRCAPSGVPEPTFARLDLRNGALTIAGAALPDAAARWLADTLVVEAAAYRPGWSFAHVFGDRHGLPILAYTVLRDGAGAAIAAYSKTSCLEIDGASVFALVAASTTALPPSLTGGLPPDSLLTLYVRDPHDHVVHESPLAWASTVFGSTGPMPQLGNLELVVEIRPAVAERLVVGGVPYGGAPMALLLALLIVVSGGLAVLQIRRQHELMRTRERFISNVSHELRTPLQQILMFAELLRMEKLESADERRYSVEVIERETRRLIQLVENVLAFARSSRGGQALTRHSVDLEALVRETIAAFDPLARTSNASIRIVVDGPALAMADESAVRRILVNLLDNAVKYGPAGQTVTVTVGQAAGSTTLTVDDSGPGVPAADRARIWTDFSRLDRDDRGAIAGSGMGLAIVRDLVERMNGSVNVDDAPGGGARFVVTLPASDD